MRKRYLIILTLALCVFLMIPQIANACWAYLTVEEMVEQSDVIVVGEVIGKTGKHIENTQIGDINYIKWKFKPQYGIKGELADSEIIVVTPGEGVSIHYNLDTQGNQVILFLRNKGEYYEPLSPQGVVGIELTKEEVIVEEPFSGEELLKKINIGKAEFGIDPKEKAEMEKYIASITDVKIIKIPVTTQETPKDAEAKDIPIITVGLTLTAIAISSFIIRRRKK